MVAAGSFGGAVSRKFERGVYNLLCSSFQNQCMMADTMVVRVVVFTAVGGIE